MPIAKFSNIYQRVTYITTDHIELFIFSKMRRTKNLKNIFKKDTSTMAWTASFSCDPYLQIVKQKLPTGTGDWTRTGWSEKCCERNWVFRQRIFMVMLNFTDGGRRIIGVPRSMWYFLYFVLFIGASTVVAKR